MLLNVLRKLKTNQPIEEADRLVLIRSCEILLRFYTDLEPTLLAGYAKKDLDWIVESDKLIQGDREF